MAGQENLLNPAPTNTVDVLVDFSPLQRPHQAAGAKNLQKPCDGRAPVSQLGKLAQRANHQSLSSSAPAIPVQKVAVPFGTKRCKQPTGDKGIKQSVLQFGGPSVVSQPRTKAQAKAKQKQSKLSFAPVSRTNSPLQWFAALRPHGSSSARSTWNDEYVHFLLVRCLELRLAGGTQKLLSWFVTVSGAAA